jgi:DNA polymerase (family 10)
MKVDAAVSPTLIAARLRQAGEMLRLLGENPWRAAAYQGGAEAIESLSEDLAALVEQGRLTDVRGIGPSLAAIIADLVRTGQSATLDRIMGELPPGLLALAPLPGMTLRRLRALHDQLGIEGMDDLRQALTAGAVETVKGFGPRTAGKLQEALTRAPAPAEAKRTLLLEGLEWAERLVSHLRAASTALAVEAVGSVRRRLETVGDVNLLAASTRPEDVVAALTSYPAVAAVSERRSASCRVRLANGLRVTLDVTQPDRFAAALVMATGAPAHVRRLEARAAQHRGGGTLAELPGADEASIYGALGLPYIPPELREDRGEIEEAEAGDDFADLISEADIRGMVHCHSLYSDGRHSVADMAAAALAMGMEYITITDHSPSASYAGGVSATRLAEQWRDIAAAEEALAIRILRGTESDILEDGGLDYPDDLLQSLDIVVASIHERHRLDRAAMTERIVRAMGLPMFKIWGHGLGRLLLRRPPVDCDVERVLEVIARSPAAIEVNGSPYRLDLPAEWLRPARKRGIKFVISVDAHSTAELGNLRHGVAHARRGGLRRSDVLNTLSVDEFARAVVPRRARPA